jgi:hypothetical protein
MFITVEPTLFVVVLFVFSEIKWEVIVRFANISEIVYEQSPRPLTNWLQKKRNSPGLGRVENVTKTVLAWDRLKMWQKQSWLGTGGKCDEIKRINRTVSLFLQSVS